jgi:hypothetical protein
MNKFKKHILSVIIGFAIGYIGGHFLGIYLWGIK